MNICCCLKYSPNIHSSSITLFLGDITINPSASCIVMTTEILRSMLYRGSGMIAINFHKHSRQQTRRNSSFPPFVNQANYSRNIERNRMGHF